jgi:hypothetical protein
MSNGCVNPIFFYDNLPMKIKPNGASIFHRIGPFVLQPGVGQAVGFMLRRDHSLKTPLNIFFCKDATV